MADVGKHRVEPDIGSMDMDQSERDMEKTMNLLKRIGLLLLLSGIFSSAIADTLFKNTLRAVRAVEGAGDNVKNIILTTCNNRDNLQLTPENIAGLGIKKVTLSLKYGNDEALIGSVRYFDTGGVYGWAFPEWHSNDPHSSIVSVKDAFSPSEIHYRIIKNRSGAIYLDSVFQMRIKDGQKFDPSSLQVKARYQTGQGQYLDEFIANAGGACDVPASQSLTSGELKKLSPFDAK